MPRKRYQKESGMLKAIRRPLILCVEDEPLLLRDLCDELEEAGYQPIGVPDVPAALLVLSRMKPSLILCDVGLPGQSGLDLLAELRETDAHSSVPFLLLTALSDREHVLRGARAGADDYLIKPVDYDLLLATVDARLAKVQRLQRLQRDALQRSLDEVHRHWHGVLDSLGHCALVCDGQLSIQFANRQAYAQCHGQAQQDSPLVVDAAGQMVLRQVLAQHPGVRQFLRSQQESASFDVPAVPGGPPYWCLAIQSLSGKDGGDEEEHGDGAPDARGQRFALFINSLQQSVKPSAEALARRFALTPAETQVARLLVDGMSKQQMCAQLQVSASTMAFHLRNMFAKTQTGRQAELVAVLLTAALGASAPASH